ncbi:motility protein A [Anaerovorax odorimutans]|uniref:motility protein A n=1 Tax=Anaerovorax odorimutans TaxID=109327 RepID=UPI0004205026|nr:motility protein A [Anaerovorax odorimutans]
MDLTTLLGIVSGILLVGYGIGLGNFGNFLSASSIVMTLGGTLAAITASFPLSTLKGVLKHLKIVVSGRKYNPIDYIDTIAEFAQIARKNGLLALEEKANEQSDPFLKDSILLIVDAIDPDKVKQMLEDDMAYLDARHQESTSIYEKGAAFAPAFGMIGTLIGLINMLKALSFSDGSGSDQLGEGMSLALITTFYGTILANLFFAPIANKLKLRHEEEMLCKEIVVEGILSIQSGENPKFIREKLISFLPQKERALIMDEGGEEGSGNKAKKEKKPKKEKKAKG